MKTILFSRSPPEVLNIAQPGFCGSFFFFLLGGAVYATPKSDVRSIFGLFVYPRSASSKPYHPFIFSRRASRSVHLTVYPITHLAAVYVHLQPKQNFYRFFWCSVAAILPSRLRGNFFS
jgi:hypothetical protein